MSARADSESGAAAVEMALSLIVLVPLMFYTLFLDDLLRFRLDAQEAALSTVWDTVNLDYSQAPKIGSSEDDKEGDKVGKMARLQFCDHTSAYDSFDEAYDCEGDRHHVAVSAHVCWMVGEAKQVSCWGPDKSVGTASDSTASGFGGQFTKGGMITCSARAAVLNYLLPQHFLQEFERGVEVTDKDKFKGSVHSNAGTANSQNAFLFGTERLAILTDTWALLDVPDLAPTSNNGQKKGPIYDRVANIYQGNPMYGLFAADATSFISQGYSDMLMPGLQFIADNPLTPNVSIAAGTDSSPPPPISIRQSSGTGSYYATPWLDWDQNRPQSTWNARGKYYMGCTEQEGC